MAGRDNACAQPGSGFQGAVWRLTLSCARLVMTLAYLLLLVFFLVIAILVCAAVRCEAVSRCVPSGFEHSEE